MLQYVDVGERSGARMRGAGRVRGTGAAAIHLYASRWGYETLIMPLAHSVSFEEATQAELGSVARATCRAVYPEETAALRRATTAVRHDS